MIRIMNNHYVLMGDVIDSHSQEDKTKLIQGLKKQVTEVNQKLKPFIASPLTVTLGDEFQGIISDPKTLFEAIFYFEESLLTAPNKYILRYSTYYGAIDTSINERNAHGMYGDGLTQARKRLEAMKTRKSRFSIALGQEDIAAHLQLLFELYQANKDRWPTSQYEMISHYLKNPDYNSLYKAGYYKTKAGAWKIVQSLDLNNYINIKKLILQTLTWLL